MNADHHRGSAKIYIFPLRPRMSAGNGMSSQDIGQFKDYVDCESWYHQDAIDESNKEHQDGAKHS